MKQIILKYWNAFSWIPWTFEERGTRYITWGYWTIKKESCPESVRVGIKGHVID